jgi:hypothetical protein
LIVIYSKRSLYFREDCGIFCEGEWEQQRHLDGHTGLVDFIGLFGLIRLIGFVDFIGDVGLVGLNGCANLIDLQPTHDLVDNYGVIGCADLIVLIKIVGYNGQISLVSLIDRISLVSLSGFISHISFVGLSLVSLGGLISHFSLVGRCIIGLIDLSALSNHWPIGLIGVISLGLIALSASTASLARRLISFISLVSSLTHWLVCERIATAINEATKTTRWLKEAAALGVATLRFSANEIANAASTYYLIALSFHVHSLVREKMWWWLALARKKLCWWLASFGESYHGDVLQHAKHLFSLRLPQMTKYCVMRECDNIHSWISLSGDLAFSHQHGIYGFKFPKRFLEISSRDLTLFVILII